MSQVSRPLISVIIPTRERVETLKVAIATVLSHEFDLLELIVSDNCSEDSTREMVAGIKDRRLIYVNTGRRLSMCDNYEFALNHAKGRYTVMIGDDDAVMPGAIQKLAMEIESKPEAIYTWPKGIYVWPFPGRAATIERMPSLGPRRELNLRQLAYRCVAQGLWGYTRLPNAYHSAVESRLWEAIRETTGRVFHSTQPDLFTGFALPAFAEKAIDLGYPLTLHGRSVKANGGVAVDKNAVANFHRFVKEYGDYAIHKSLFPAISPHANFLPDALLIAMDKFPGLYAGKQFNYEGMWTLFCMGETFGFDVKVSQVVRYAREIQQFHPLSVPRFLALLVVYNAFLKARGLMQRSVPLGPFKNQVPDNIHDFVQQYVQWQSPPHNH